MTDDILSRRESAEKWVCPDCGRLLVAIPARLIHKAHAKEDVVRACPFCEYWGYFGGDTVVTVDRGHFVQYNLEETFFMESTCPRCKTVAFVGQPWKEGRCLQCGNPFEWSMFYDAKKFDESYRVVWESEEK